jgi:dTDP-3-amino-2,3,6-trideoxy-4-keto-D-glucose/dTDP-3-amino-3,4,6-trideoxy-alpha-D-glucose/dTDP-2,6-dideoxy-D-kanosamine transaminase
VLNLKTGYIDEWLRRRRDIANYYNFVFEDSAVGRDLGADLPGNSYYHFVVAVDRRDELQERLYADGIETAVHYPIPVHRQAAWIRRYGYVSLPTTEELATKILTVPCHPALSDSEVEYVCSNVTLRA